MIWDTNIQIYDGMEGNNHSRNKELVVDKTFNPYPFKFIHLKVEKPPPFVRDIWLLVLLINSNRCVKIFIPRMGKWFQLKDKLVRVKHEGVTFRLVS
jgi:hypothetical protein